MSTRRATRRLWSETNPQISNALLLMCSELEPQFPPLQIERYHLLDTVNVKICKVKIT